MYYLFQLEKIKLKELHNCIIRRVVNANKEKYGVERANNKETQYRLVWTEKFPWVRVFLNEI